MEETGGTFLVVEAQTLVQMDLAQVVRDVRPAATVLAAQTLDQAAESLAEVSSLHGAIIGGGATSLKESGLAPRIAALGGWIVCLNGRHAEAIRAEGWYPLALPFTSDDALRLIRGLMDGRAAS